MTLSVGSRVFRARRHGSTGNRKTFLNSAYRPLGGALARAEGERPVNRRLKPTAGSNPAPATTCENVPLAADFRPCGAFLFCPVVSHSVAPWIAVLRGARTHSGRRPGVAGLGGRTDQTVKSTDGSGMPTVYVPCHASEMALQAAGSQQARGCPLAGQLTGRRLLSRPLLGSRGSAGSLMVRARGSGGTLTTRATASARGGALFVCNSCVPWLCREAGKLTMAAAGNAGAAVVRGRASHGRAAFQRAVAVLPVPA